MSEEVLSLNPKQGFGPERICAKLVQKGIASETVERTLMATALRDEREEAQRFLASRYSVDALKQPKVYAQAFRLLSRRGYTQDVVESVLGNAPSDD